MKALIELDVTNSRKMIRAFRRQKKEKISFMSWILKCIGQAVSENKEVHGIRKGKFGLIIFDDIDISIAVEKVVNGSSLASGDQESKCWDLLSKNPILFKSSFLLY